MNKRILAKAIVLSILVSCFLLFTPSVFAAELFFDSRVNEVGIRQEIEISLFLNTENETINAVEGEIIIPSDSVELKEIRDSNSIIPLWLEKPFLKKSNVIRLAGIIPGGFNSSRGYLLSLIIESNQVGKYIFDLKDLNILLNDGKGTSLPVNYEKYELSVIKKQKILPAINQIDKTKPEEFELIISRDPKIFDNNWFITLTAQDKGTGIKDYSIQETRTGRLKDNNWLKFKPPYQLKDQSRKSYIFVKVTDQADNELLKILNPKFHIKWWEDYYNWVIIILGVILPLMVVSILIKKVLKK